MSLAPPMSPDHIHIADEAINRVHSHGGGSGSYTQEKIPNTYPLKSGSSVEREIDDDGDDGDERDIKKKQVPRSPSTMA